jgi:Proto-chlorophyllide reductase 57 kD subunit
MTSTRGLATGRRPRALWLPAEEELDPAAEWSADAERQLHRLPPIVRGVVRSCVDRYARSRAIDLITPSVIRAARIAARV